MVRVGPWRSTAVPDGRRRDEDYRQSHGSLTPGPERRRRDGRDGTMTGKKVSCMEKEVSRMERFKAECMNPKCSGHPVPVAGEATTKIGRVEISLYVRNFQRFWGLRRPKTRVRRLISVPRTAHEGIVNVSYNPHECRVCGLGNKNFNMPFNDTVSKGIKVNPTKKKLSPTHCRPGPAARPQIHERISLHVSAGLFPSVKTTGQFLQSTTGQVLSFNQPPVKSFNQIPVCSIEHIYISAVGRPPSLTRAACLITTSTSSP